VAQRVGMSAAIDTVDFGMQRGGVLSLSADPRSTRLQEILSRRLHRAAGKSIARRAAEQIDIAIFEPFVGEQPAAAHGGCALAKVGSRGARRTTNTEAIFGGSGVAAWMR
jgi:hypothetical protein